LLFLTACADTTRIKSDDRYNRPGLSRSASAYIAVPADGSYGDKVYQGSGGMVAGMIRTSLQRHLNQVREASGRQSFDEALRAAKSGGLEYLFFPAILHWEDRATEWNMMPDQVSVRLDVIDVASAKRIASATIDGKSGISTLGGDHPQDLLYEPMAKYISQLF